MGCCGGDVERDENVRKGLQLPVATGLHATSGRAGLLHGLPWPPLRAPTGLHRCPGPRAEPHLDFVQGVVKDRKCRDVLCLIFFIAFWGGM